MDADSHCVFCSFLIDQTRYPLEESVGKFQYRDRKGDWAEMFSVWGSRVGIRVLIRFICADRIRRQVLSVRTTVRFPIENHAVRPRHQHRIGCSVQESLSTTLDSTRYPGRRRHGDIVRPSASVSNRTARRLVVDVTSTVDYPPSNSGMNPSSPCPAT
jgi:hypothetical protein